MSNVLSQRRHERHPVGLLVIIVLHVLLALAIWTSRLQVDPLPKWQPPLAQIDEPPSQQAASHDLPSAPATAMRQIVVPVPEVIVDQVDPIRATTVEAPPAPESVIAAAAATPVATSGGSGSGPVTTVGKDGGTGGPPVRVDPRPATVDPYAAQCQPPYPEAARLHHVAGTTRLRFTVDAAGHIVDVRTIRRSGQMPENFLLDRTAMEYLVRCPAQAGVDDSGKPVGGTTDINYIWNMTD